MARPARIKTEKHAYDDGLSVGSDGSGMSGGAWPSQADFDKPDSFVRAWIRGFSDGQSDRLGQFRPAWSIDNPKRKTVKKRKFRRVAKRRPAGRTMTVTTSSRVVKTTRMNPRGLDISPYRREFTIGRYKHSINHSTSSKNTRAIMRKLFPGWSKEDHVERLIRLSRMIHVASAVWGRIADKAHGEAFPGKRRGMLDYKISGVGRDEYPERLKGRLRIAARQEGTIVSAIHAHAMMAGKTALRRAKIDPNNISMYKAGLSNPASKAKITDAYRKSFFTAFLVAALWSTNDESDESGGLPLDSNYGIDDFSKDSLDSLRRDCDRFIDKYAPVLAAIDADGRESAEQAGHDFWLTRNGHGVGFQDRNLGAIGERLAKSVGWRTPFPEINLYVGDDGKVHADGSTMRSNPRVSKTHVEFIIQGNYGYGWDDENTEETLTDAKRSLREYRENGPGSYRLIRRRVKNDATNPKRRYVVDPITRRRVRVKSHRVLMGGGVKRRRDANSARMVKGADGVWSRPNPKGYGKTKYRGHVIEVTFFHGEVGNKAFWVASVSKDGRHIMDLDTTKSRPDAYKVARAFIDQRANPGDPRTADTQRLPAVIRVSIPASGKDPRSAETRRLRVITSAHRKNPVRNLVVPRKMWKSLSKKDRRTRAGHRYVRCKTRRSRRAFWLPCTIR